MSARMRASVDIRKKMPSPEKYVPREIMEEAVERFHALVN